MKDKLFETSKEEILNGITHGIGAVLSSAALTLLVVFASLKGDPWKIVSFSIYGFSMLVLYLSSTFYHAIKRPKIKKFFHIMDHASIFMLIAGTYTPFTLVTMRGPWGWSIFGTIWGLAIAGIILKFFFTGRFNTISTIIYLVMGWLVIIAIKPLIDNLDFGGLMWLFAGGAFYSLGVIFYRWEKLKYSHVIWHLFVLGGSISHFLAVLFYVL